MLLFGVLRRLPNHSLIIDFVGWHVISCDCEDLVLDCLCVFWVARRDNLNGPSLTPFVLGHLIAPISGLMFSYRFDGHVLKA